MAPRDENLAGFWNWLNDERRRGEMSLSPVAVSNPPKAREVRALAERRHEEIRWFIRGIDAGGDDPMEFGAEAKELFEGLAKASGFCKAYCDLIDRDAPTKKKDLVDAAKTLAALTATVENVMLDLAEIGDAVRREAIDELRARAGTETDDGVLVRRAAKVGRNDPCPCGSGKKWKKGCGATKPPGAVTQ
jgi:hypothetical protein